MESTCSATFWWSLWISVMKSAKRGIFAVLGDAEVNDEDLETIFIGQGRQWEESLLIRDLEQLWVTTLTTTAFLLQTTFWLDS